MASCYKEKNTVTSEQVIFKCLMIFIIYSCLSFLTKVHALNSAGSDVSQCTYQSSLALGSTMTLYWNVLKNPDDALNHILEFGLICKYAGYCSIGFDHPYRQGMQSIDTLFAYTSSSGKAYVKEI